MFLFKKQRQILIIKALILISVTNSSAQEKQEAFALNMSYTADIGRNFYGGISQNNAFLGNIDLTLNLDAEKARLWKGGTFFLYLLNNHGNSLSQYVGDLQGVDNIETTTKSKLYQFWYQHQYKNWTFTIGQHDLNSVFCNTKYGSAFINSSFGIQPDISANVPLSIFPTASLGFIAAYQFNNNFKITAAIYDGTPEAPTSNPSFINWKLSRKEGVLSIVEFEFNNKHSKRGSTYKIGAWNHSSDSHYGMYAIGDQKLWTPENNSNQGLACFSQVGISPKKDCDIDYYSSFGMHYTGLFSNDDQLGLAFAHASIQHSEDVTTTNEYPSENVIELTYQLQLSKHISIQPDIQYVLSPGGNNTMDNALVGIFRTVWSF